MSKIQLNSIEDKINHSLSIVEKAFKKFDLAKLAVAITGGKDSTLTLWLIKQFCDKKNIKLPLCVFIDEGDTFEEIFDFINSLKEDWSLDLIVIKNDEILSKVKNIGDIVFIKDLSDELKEELKLLNYKQPYLKFNVESFVGNHLMKTYPLKKFIKEYSIEGLFTGLRWDEHESRKDEVYFSPRKNPDHIRIHPILHFTERDVWNAILKYNIPFCSLYKLGYRSLGAKSTTYKSADIPAWEQDLENTPERAGRYQEKEKLMSALRDLGYM